MTTPYPEFAIASYVLAAADENKSGKWMKILTESRSDTTVNIPDGASTCTFSNTSPRSITIGPRVVYGNTQVVFLPQQEVQPGKSAMFKISASGNCYLSIIQQVWVDPKGQFGLEIVTMPPATS